MRFDKLYLNHFGKFHNKEIKLEEGINLIYGDNEAGKSTIHSFIRGMLFGIEKLRGRASKDDTYLKYQPWDTPGAYHGSMDITVNGKSYRIIRNFDKSTKGLSVLDIETGRELNLKPEELTDLYGGLTEAGYRNTISIEQRKAKTDQELVQELRNYITNLTLTKSKEVDVTKALAYLQEKKKGMDTMQIPKKLASLEEEIVELMGYEDKLDRLSRQLEETTVKEIELRRKVELADWLMDGAYKFTTVNEYKTHLEHFPVIREKYSSYCENFNLKLDLKEKLEQVKLQLQESEKSQKEYNKIKSNLEQLETLKSCIASEESKKAQLGQRYGWGLHSRGIKQLVAYLIPVIAIAAGLIFFVVKNYLPAVVCTGVGILSLIVLRLLSHARQKKQHQYVQELHDYEQHIQDYQAEIKAILAQSDEHGLRKRLEELLSHKLSMEHRTNLIIEYQDQIAVLDKKLSLLKEEIFDYIYRTPDVLSMDRSGREELSGSLMCRLEHNIGQMKQQLAEHQDTAIKEYQSFQLQREKMKWELEELADKYVSEEENLIEKKAQQKELLQRKVEMEQESEAITLAMETIHTLSIEIHDSFGGKLNRKISELTKEITNGKYNDVKVDEKLNIKVGQKDNYVVLDKLSSGTIDQLYLSLRLSIADMVYGEGFMPIILDDCFALYDDFRTKAALETLVNENKGQVIVFTCHNREKEVLDQMRVKYHYIDLSAE